MEEISKVYTLPGFSAYEVTKGGEVYKTQMVKSGRKRIKLLPTADLVYNLVDDKGKRCRYPWNRIWLAATNKIDPKDSAAITRLQDTELHERIATSVCARVDRAGNSQSKTEEIVKELKNVICYKLTNKDAADLALADVVARDLVVYYKLYTQITNAESMTVTELSREGNERVSAHPLITAYQKQSEQVQKGLARFGITHDDIAKLAPEAKNKALELFEDADFNEIQGDLQ